ncbi:exonuclease domain-containing protein [Lentzea aerocolonigenes]|uniref:exonuclease domain-containing protein n=1 Tax=Lentzea aerocolonigenes TaxID=68170 RepID=UPI0004C2EE0E|nr:exonuclease domain-containing protein [Lentzea aerocolonigenes]MCP2246340.1 DNA polymerase-3 subunit epsilon [Lentzea aerocolonigenes]
MGNAYAVVDVETTGLSPGHHHRVIEVAVVHVDETGRRVDEWCTLVNPRRDLGAQHVHGITAAEARRAPDFAAIAPELAARLSGRVLVAHNLSFDLRFLQAEFARLGHELPASGVCTMELAGRYLGASSRSLAACCSAAGVPMGVAHSALHDARASAGLLMRCLDRVGDVEPVRLELPRTGAFAVQRSRAHGSEQHFLAKLVRLLPRVETPWGDEYLDVLDRALVDRHLSADEQEELLDVAQALDLGLPQVMELHRGYLAALAEVAWEDGRLSADEEADLRLVASLLGVDVAEVLRPSVRLSLGDLVVFTGEMREPRDVWESRASSAGLTVKGGVTKRTALVIAADPDTMSGKADKARAYGIPVVSEDSFAGLLGELTGGAR